MSKTKKAAKKATKKPPAAARGYRPDNKTKSAPATATRREARAMSDEKNTEELQAIISEQLRKVNELEQENAELKFAVQTLKERNQEMLEELAAAGDAAQARLAAPGENVQPITGRRYVRGKLPGDKLIRIDTLTNQHEAVTQEEWDAIPAGSAR
jgi:hypothetical protein